MTGMNDPKTWGVQLWLDPINRKYFNPSGLRRLIALHRINLTELAIVLDLNPVTVWRWNNETNPPSRVNLEKLEDLADITNFCLSISTIPGQLMPDHQLHHTYPWDIDDRNRGDVSTWMEEMKRLAGVRFGAS